MTGDGLRRGVREVLIAVAAVLIGLAAMETIARLGFTASRDLARLRGAASEPEWSYVLSPEFGWLMKPGFNGPAEGGIRAIDDEGFLAADTDQLDDDKPKVLFIGDSNTFGFGVPTPASFPEVVDAQLPTVSAINLGVPGYTSYQGRLTLEKYLPRFRPAVVVAAFNFNDRRAVLAGHEDSPAEFSRMFTAGVRRAGRVNTALEFLYLYRGLRVGLRALGLAPAPVSERPVPLDSLRPRVSEAAYRDNLIAIVELARRAGAHPVFVLMHDNPLETGHVSRGMDKLERGDVDGAIEDLSATFYLSDSSSDLARQQLVRAYRLKGDQDAIERVRYTDLWGRGFDGSRPIRLDHDYNTIMRAVAEEYAVELVDAAAALDADPWLYIDSCHFNTEGHRTVAGLLVDRLRPLLGLPAGA